MTLGVFSCQGGTRLNLRRGVAGNFYIPFPMFRIPWRFIIGKRSFGKRLLRLSCQRDFFEHAAPNIDGSYFQIAFLHNGTGL